MTSAYRTSPALLLLLCLLLPWAAQAQVFPRGNATALTGLHQTDVYVSVSDWIDMPEEPAAFRLGTQRAFEQELADSGISRRSGGHHYLVCDVQATTIGTDVTYTATVELWNLRSTDVHTMLWESGSMATAGVSGFNAERVGSECAQQFLAEWTRWNS